MEIMQDTFIKETNAEQLSIASYSIPEIKTSQEATFENESIA